MSVTFDIFSVSSSFCCKTFENGQFVNKQTTDRQTDNYIEMSWANFCLVPWSCFCLYVLPCNLIMTRYHSITITWNTYEKLTKTESTRLENIDSPIYILVSYCRLVWSASNTFPCNVIYYVGSKTFHQHRSYQFVSILTYICSVSNRVASIISRIQLILIAKSSYCVLGCQKHLTCRPRDVILYHVIVYTNKGQSCNLIRMHALCFVLFCFVSWFLIDCIVLFWYTLKNIIVCIACRMLVYWSKWNWIEMKIIQLNVKSPHWRRFLFLIIKHNKIHLKTSHELNRTS